MIAERPSTAAVGGDEGESESETYSEIGSTGQWGTGSWKILELLQNLMKSNDTKF